MSKSTKIDKRIQKKQKRSQHTVLRHENLTVVSFVTNHIVVSNGGLSNGVNREEIYSLFSQHGEVIDIVMKAGKPYCFVTMGSEEAAEKVYNIFNGRELTCPGELAIQGVTFYISFIQSVPGYEPAVYHSLPSGLIILEEFVSPDYEQKLLGSIDWDSVDNKLLPGNQQVLKHRRVKHYGYEFVYGVNNIDKNQPLENGIPAECERLLHKVIDLELRATRPDQLTVNQYEPGQGIPPHIDTHSACDDVILSLSLGSQAVMDFKHPDGRHIPVLLPRRSLLVMTGETRYVWTHGITPRKSDIVPVSKVEGCKESVADIASHDTTENSKIQDNGANMESKLSSRLTLLRRELRTSFTFRKVLGQPCTCEYKAQCDSRQNASSASDEPTTAECRTGITETKVPSSEDVHREAVPVTETDAQQLEHRLVHQVYEDIAGHFSDTRHSPWPKVVEFLNQQPPGSFILDVGCGNGKYLGANDKCYKVGSDRSVNLCTICGERGFPVFVSDCLLVPVRQNSVDVVISIAVIHHLSTAERRLNALLEISKVLRVGGKALIYVWALEQELNKMKSNYLKESKENPKCEVNSSVKETSSKSATVKNEGHSELHTEHRMQDLKIHCDAGGKPVNESDPEMTSGKERNETEESESTQYLPVHVNRTQFVSQDLLVPWHLRNKTEKQKADLDNNATCTDSVSKHPSVYHRFYHVFKQGELEELCGDVSDLRVLHSYYDKGNWCVILQKV